ncbi:MAG: thiamine-phosphate kinase [candidate division WOR-3 bacterium]
MRIDQIGESKLIKFIQNTVKTRNQVKVGIGDDACVLKDGKTVLTTDTYAAGVHFDLSYMSYYDVGCRCTCACLSDVVAMAAEPQILLVALGVPRKTEVRDVLRLYKGIDFICKKLGCEVAGGDIVALDRLIITLTALGKTVSPKLRSHAQPGEFVCLTGFAGLAETGRLILKNRPSSLFPLRSSKIAVMRHICPLPRVEVMRKLRNKFGALIDTSDGLATDTRHIAESSNVRVVLYPNLLPIHPTTKGLCQRLKTDLIEFCLKGGEDYELLFTSSELPPPEICNTPITVIGKIEKGSGVFIEKQGKLTPLKIKGYDHLS